MRSLFNRLPSYTPLYLSLLIPLAFFCVGLWTINDFGETGDERFDRRVGQFYFNGKGSLDNLQHNYGPLFDTIAYASNYYLHSQWGILDSTPAFHFPVLVISTVMISTIFLLAYCAWGAWPAFFASLIFSIMPRFVGESQNNLKDVPVAALFTVCLFLYFIAHKKRRLHLFVLAGVSLGLTYATKINGLLLLPILLLWVTCVSRFRLSEARFLIPRLGMSILVAIGTVILVWPSYRDRPLDRFLETYRTFKHHPFNEYVLYLGQHFKAGDIPWHYPFVMFAVTTPIPFLVLLGGGIAFSIRSFYSEKTNDAALQLCLIWLLTPILIQATVGSYMCDGIRHFMTVVPAISLLAGYAVWRVGTVKALQGRAKWLYGTLIACLFLVTLIKNIQLHPYQVVYFNRLAGGVKGAYGVFDLDYWAQSYKEAGEYINKYTPKGSRIWSTFPGGHLLYLDRDHPLSGERDFPNFKVNLIRGMLKTLDPEDNYLSPKRAPIYSITVDGGDILQIFHLGDKDSASLSPNFEPLSLDAKLLLPGLSVRASIDSRAPVPIDDSTISSTLYLDCKNNQFFNKVSNVYYSGFLSVIDDSRYCIYAYSDDAMQIRMNDEELLINSSQRSSYRHVYLRKGYYKLDIELRNNAGPACLEVKWSKNNCDLVSRIGTEVLWHE